MSELMLTPPHSNKTTPFSSTGSTPIVPNRFSFQAGAGHSTHDSVDRHLLYELEDHLIINTPDFVERFVFPEQGSAENTRLDFLVEAVHEQLSSKGVEYWTPKTWLDNDYLPWFSERAKDICSAALITLESTTSLIIEAKGLCLNEVNGHATKDRLWRAHLKARAWATRSRAVMKGGAARRSVDIVLSASQDDVTEWTSALVLGEHKSHKADTPATMQLAGYVSEALGIQSLRHFFHGFTITPNGLRLWRFDRSGGLASTMFSCATGVADQAAQQLFIKIILAYTVMDDVKLGFDPDVFGNRECTMPCHYTARVDANNCWGPYTNSGFQKFPEFYIRMASSGKPPSVYRLLQRLFIRPGIACRATVCFLATPIENGEQCIVKFLWRYTTMAAEGASLEAVGQTEGMYGVVRLLCYDETGTTENGRGGTMSGPRLNLRTTNSEMYMEVLDPLPNRIFSRTVLRDVGRPLQSIDKPLDLVKAIFGALVGDIYPGHGSLYFIGHILHRDVSAANILQSLHPLPGPSSDIPELMGFIIDLDYAVRVDLTGNYVPSGATHRTGTLPFMAIDILYNPATTHLYNHDIESFLYVLIWYCIYKNKPARNAHTTDGPDIFSSTTSDKNSTTAPTWSGPFADEITKAEAPPRRSTRLGSKPPSRSVGPNCPPCIWELDRSHHSSRAKDPLGNWRKMPEEAAGAKMVQMRSNVSWDKLMLSLRPGFDCTPITKLLGTIRGRLFRRTYLTEEGIPTSLFATPAERIEAGQTVREITVEKKLYQDITAAFLLAIKELEALESARP
ncbi:MAG: hypothetical protein M1840_004259 [Geoglossum simile]|nr:MAG: hypothetical protein M1840_004259 [Geoglossum simile]